MILNETKITYLEKVLASKTFLNSPSSKALLRYLAQKSLDGTHLKEGIIEIEFYGEKGKSERSNPRVRVNVYNLRKRLTSYYEKEGQSDHIKLTIDKGQYNVQFQDSYKESDSKPNFKKLLPYLISILLAAILIIQNIPDSKPALWENFLTNNKKTTLFLADAFGMLSKTQTGKIGWVTDFSMHNKEDYYQFLQNNPQLKDSLSPANFTYINKSGALAAQNLANLFSKYNKEFTIRLSSKTDLDEITKGNMVYVGSKLKEEFTTLFNERNIYCKLEKYNLRIENHPMIKDTIINMHSKYTDNFDYAMVSKLKGPQDTELFFFFSNHGIGNMSTVDFFTDSQKSDNFEDKNLKGKENFVALFKVYGKERVDIRMEQVLSIRF